MGARIGAVLLGIVFAFLGAAVMAAMSELGGEELCSDADALGECVDGSQFQKTLGLAFGWPAGIAAVAVLPLGIYFAARKKKGRLMLQVAGAAVGLFVLYVITFRI